MQRIKECDDVLGATSAPVDDHDLLNIILNGCPDDYDAFVDSVQFRLADTSVNVIHSFLFSKEMAHARKKKHQGSTDSFQAFHSVQAISDAPLLPTKCTSTVSKLLSHRTTFSPIVVEIIRGIILREIIRIAHAIIDTIIMVEIITFDLQHQTCA